MGFKTFLARVSTSFTSKSKTTDSKNTGLEHQPLVPAYSEVSSLHPSPVVPSSANLLDAHHNNFLADVDVHVRLVFDQTGDMTLCSVESLKVGKAAKLVDSESGSSSVSESAFSTLFDTASLRKDNHNYEFVLPSNDSSYGRTLTPKLLLPPQPDLFPVPAPISDHVSSLVLDKPLPPLPVCPSPSLADPPNPIGRRLHVKQFKPLRVLGKGGQGTVALVEDRVSGSFLGMKIVRKAAVRTKSYPRLFDEQRIMRALAGEPWVLPLLASFDDRDHFFILTKYCPQGDLWSKIKNQRGLCPSDALRYGAELVHAIGLLHSRRIIHRDIKPENILLDGGHIVLADFGISKAFGRPISETPWKMCPEWSGNVPSVPSAGNETGEGNSLAGDEEEEDVTQKFCGTPGFMAPEMNEGEYSYEADIYAAGVVLYVMLMGRLPFGLNPRKQTLAEQFRHITELPVDFDVDGDISPDGQDLLERMLEKDPRRRATIPEIKEHPYFASIDWPALERREPVRSDSGCAHHAHPRKQQRTVDIERLARDNSLSQPTKSAFPWFQWLSPQLEHFGGDSDISRDLSHSNPFIDDLLQCGKEETASANIVTGEAKPGAGEKLGRLSTLVSGRTDAATPNVVQRVKRWWKRRGLVSVRPRVVSGRMDMLE
ncbi:cAMP-dependent protein kinase catalytic subunit alpha [Sparassis crispa]|uniref:cAMP-dependent protein kinase catalytic subunit alpha n=1 Tax=Sparassis crispa TaxID=139825 RepID=A0A401G8M7_9APHY|nr:cAMP-dependent protein kinase catalytic subunit alpha [Sparassis crispa]GBE78508.1 cAMP-dependent protein kinase catalytic subunit alpha [Sparassis crispa]